MLDKVTLSGVELHMAAIEASFRHARGRRGLKQGLGYNWDMKGHGMDINGVCGEMAFCKLMNLYWNPSTGPAPVADVGPYQIKTSHYPNAKLIVSEHCNNDICVLMVGCEETFRCAGWVLAEEARDPAFYYSIAEGRPATYNVDQEFINPFSEIPR